MMMQASLKTQDGRMPLRVQLLLLQALIVAVVTLIAGVTAGIIQAHTVRDAYEDRMLAVAQSIASMPAITSAFDDAEPSRTIQPLAETIRKASDLTYIVIADSDGIRFSHPNPERIGQRVSTDPSVPLSGQIFMGTETGTLGPSWRVKVPIFDGADVIGTVSVGILESQGDGEFVGNLFWIIGAMLAAVVLGVFGSAWVTAIIRRRIHLLEPHEISALMRNQETTMHSLSEGVITVDTSGEIVLANDAAARLLDSSVDELSGTVAAEVLDDELLAVLRDGEDAGRPVIVGSRVLVARSTGSAGDDGAAVEATLLLRDHTELHDVVRRVEAADAIIAFRARAGLPKGLSAETLERVTAALAQHPDASAAELGEVLAISRVSARRYLEHLASTGQATRSLDYSTKGRPGTRYRAVEQLLDAR